MPCLVSRHLLAFIGCLNLVLGRSPALCLLNLDPLNLLTYFAGLLDLYIAGSSPKVREASRDVESSTTQLPSSSGERLYSGASKAYIRPLKSLRQAVVKVTHLRGNLFT